MTNEQNRIIYLLHQYADNLCTQEELDELFDSIRNNQDNETLYSFLQQDWAAGKEGIVRKEPVWDELFQSIVTTPVIRKNKVGWWKIAAAASVIIIVALGVFTVISKRSEKSDRDLVQTTNDVAPPNNTRAVITLADGRKVYLDSADNGTIAQESSVSVIKTADGKIIYDTNSDKRSANSLAYNTLFNPRGSKVVSLTLSDGTKVWLNAESSVRYPASFASAAVREVEITGEAYFEVAHNASKPFHVKKGETDITVLGTHFNVNAYDDEDALKVTLLEGSVRVASNKSQVKIVPGQQAALARASQIITVNSADLDAVMAWKNGRFTYNGTEIEIIMREVARWYNVDVEFKDDIKETFFIKMSRNTNVSNVFKILQTTGGVHFSIEGKKITVMK